MKNFILLLFFLSTCFTVLSQSINFGQAEKLFDHPTDGLFALAYIPMDYNQDGITDYIGRGGENDLVVQLGIENGFEISDDISSQNFPYARPYQILDFNKDGYEDIIMEWYVYIYNPFTNDYKELSYTEAGDPQTIMGIADFDGNGYNDILTVLSSGSKQNDLAIFFYDGEDFSKEMLTDEIGIGPLELGDLENDGDIDIAVIDKYNTWTPVILINDGAGAFTTRYVQNDELLYNRTLNFEDMDGDGDLDLLAYNIDHQFFIYENTDNFLTAPVKHVIQNSSRPVSNAISDFNADGIKEIISFNARSDRFTVDLFVGNFGLNYGPKIEIASFDAPTFFLGLNPNYDQNTLQLHNVDDDGDLDLILSFSAGSDPSVYLFENLSVIANEETSAINETEQSDKISVFPNPAISEISVGNYPRTPYIILNTEGKFVQKGVYNNTIDISNLSPGTYSLLIEGSMGNKISKFVKVEY